MNIEIKDLDGKVLFSHEQENNTLQMTLEEGVKQGVSLAGANLAGANLTGANLTRADLDGADLARANLARANLAGANLTGAYLTGANLTCLELSGRRPIVQVGPIGSRQDWLVAYMTEAGLRLDAGCQRQITRELFESRLHTQHAGNEHEKEYRAALSFIDAHFQIWAG